jgi:hypothetical protein
MKLKNLSHVMENVVAAIIKIAVTDVKIIQTR